MLLLHMECVASEYKVGNTKPAGRLAINVHGSLAFGVFYLLTRKELEVMACLGPDSKL